MSDERRGDPVSRDIDVLSVFDRIHRNDGTPATASESTFEFLNRVDSVFFDRVRVEIEGWWENLCADARHDVRSRLRSRDNRHFRSAFWEPTSLDALRLDDTKRKPSSRCRA